MEEDIIKEACEILDTVRYMNKDSGAYVKVFPSGRRLMVTTQEERDGDISWHIRLLTPGSAPIRGVHASGPMSLVAQLQSIIRADRAGIF